MKSQMLSLALGIGSLMCAGAVYDVTEFGANGADAEDDSYAIQNALNKAKDAASRVEIRVPAGTYRLSSPLGIYSNTSLLLDSNAKFLRTTGDVKVMMFGAHLNSDGTPCPRDASCSHGRHGQVSNVVIRGGIWDGGDYADSISGALVLSHGDSIEVSDVTFRRFTEHVVNCSASRNVTLQNLRFESMTRYSGNSPEFWMDYDIGDENRYLSIEAIHLDVANAAGEPSTYPHDDTPCEQVVVRDCIFSDGFAGVGNHHVIPGAAEDGFVVDSCFFTNLCSYAVHAHGFVNCRILGNRAVNTLGLVWARASRLDLTNNVVKMASGYGMLLKEGTEAVVTGNEISRIALHGVHVEDSTGRIAGNRISQCEQCGVRGLSAVGLCVEDNEIGETKESGISLTSSSAVTVRRNDVRAPGISGVMLEGGSANLTDNLVTGSKQLGCHFQSSAQVVAVGNRIVGSGDSGIYLKTAGEGVEISSCLVSNVVSHGINAVGTHGAKLRNNVIADVGRSGIALDGSRSAVVASNRIERTISGDGVLMTGGTVADVTENDIRRIALHGVHVEGAGGRIGGNRISQCAQCGVRGLKADGLTVAGNEIDGAQSSGVALTGSSSAQICRNVIASPAVAGVTLESGSARLTDNLVTGSKLLGCRFLSSAQVVAERNQIVDSGDSGIYLKDAGEGVEISSCVVSNAAAHGVDAVGSSGLKLRNSVIANITGAHGITLKDVRDAVIASTCIMGTRSRGCTVSGGSCRMSGCEIARTGDFGFYGDNGATVELLDTFIHDTDKTAVRLTGLVNPVLDGNRIVRIKAHGVQVSGVTGARLHGNEIGPTQGCGMLLDTHSASCMVMGNVIAQTGQEGIYYQHSSSGHIASNDVSLASGVGVRVAGTASADIIGNVISNAASSMRDMSVEAAASGSVVAGNVCLGNGLGFSAGALAVARYVPADAAVSVNRRPDGGALVEWTPIPLGGYGTGWYVLEYGHDPAFASVSSQVIDCGGLTSSLIPESEASSPFYARVRFVHRISGLEYASAGDESFAGWLKDCRISFNAGGGDGSMASLFVDPGIVVNLPACKFTNDGLRFAGWSGSNGRRYDDGVLVFGLVGPDGGSVTMTAIWQ